ncbi:hypothetical protein [Nitrosomonas sp. Is37]|uniref:hypothetical protein n=1 Tax=Nitrosomonas sp. Is37 TaxID=3080535 RepID=UPI00294ADA4C|nr:hypothetical protein [Nitrosomonas sp. Is37]MDV6342959.1 hypothetical protein [Nitrosomonas sp. Is37]
MQAAHKTGFIALGLMAFLTSVNSQASDTVELAGDVLRFVLPTTGARLALAHKDGTGALQLGDSVALTLGVTYSLKYTIDEERPNGGKHSFPSVTASLSFASAEFMRTTLWPVQLLAILSSYLFTTPYKGWQVVIEDNAKYHGIRLTRIW